MDALNWIKMIIGGGYLEPPFTIKILQPTVFLIGKTYCCLFGSNAKEGITGLGETAESAIEDWHIHLLNRIRQPSLGDKAAWKAIHILNNVRDSDNSQQFLD